MKDEIKEILDDKKVIIDQHWNYIIIGNEKYYELPKKLLNYITNLQEENEKLKKLHNEELYRRIKAHQYILKNMIRDPLYQGSKVDGENVINILNGGE